MVEVVVLTSHAPNIIGNPKKKRINAEDLHFGVGMFVYLTIRSSYHSFCYRSFYGSLY